MVCTTRSTTSPPCPATWQASRAISLAKREFSALFFTTDVSSSIDAAVSSSALACASLRAESSRLPVAICADAVAMVSVPLRTPETMRVRLPFISWSAPISSAVSSRPLTVIVVCKSPAATLRAIITACASGRVMLRTSQKVIRMLAISVSAIVISSIVRVC